MGGNVKKAHLDDPQSFKYFCQELVLDWDLVSRLAAVVSLVLLCKVRIASASERGYD